MGDNEALTHVDKVFNEALDRCPEDRAAFLASVCDDGELREVEALLAAAEEMEDFLERPVLSLSEEPQELHEGQAVGVYRIVRSIGRGGMGKVYLASRDDGLYQQEVAVKVLKRGLDTEEIVLRFNNERQLLARLDHPNVVKIFDGGETGDGLPFFVMEYVEGEPIDRYCQTRRLPVRARVELFRRVCSVVAFAHQNLVVHRDLKPQNVLIDRRGEPKLLDFGIAKLLETGQASVTLTGLQPMTREYAAPEQILGGLVTTASDVYSLGRLLYEILTGTKPFSEAAGGSSLSHPALEQDPQLPSRVAPDRDLAGDLDSIVLKALEKNPQNRYASVDHLSEDLDRYLEGLPVRARQATARYRLGKLVRRHRLGVAAAAVALVGILGFGTSMAVLRSRAVREQQRAELAQQQAIRQRQRAEEVTQFLMEAFRNPDPEVSREPEISLRRFLDVHAGTIGDQLERDPETRAALMNAMGEAYLGLGLFGEAAPLLEESLRLRRSSPHTRPEELASSLVGLAEAKMGRDDYEDTERLVREALEILRRRGTEDRALARALNNLALLLKRKGEVEGAEELYRESLAMRIRLVGREHPDVAKAQNNLAAALKDQGNYDEAESLYRKSLALKIKLYGEGSPEVATTRNNLALLLVDRGDPQSAEPILRNVLDTRRRIYGDRHSKVAGALVNLGFALRLGARFEEAEALYGEALGIYVDLFGETHSSVANVLRHQASLQLAQGRAEQAEEVARRALQVFRITKNEDHPRFAEAESVLGACLLAQGRDEEALPLLRRAYEALRASKGDAARQTRKALESLEQLAPDH